MSVFKGKLEASKGSVPTSNSIKSLIPSLSSSSSSILMSPSLSLSRGILELSSGSLPPITSVASRKPSPSSSVSMLFPIPSASVSVHSVGSAGKASSESITPSLSKSPSELEPEEPPDTLQTFKSSVIVIFTVVEAVFPDESVIV